MMLSNNLKKMMSGILVGGLLVGCAQPILAKKVTDEERAEEARRWREKKKAAILITIGAALTAAFIFSIIQCNKNQAEKVAQAINSLVKSGWDLTVATEAVNKCGCGAVGALMDLIEAGIKPTIAIGTVSQYGSNSEQILAILSTAQTHGAQGVTELLTRFQDQKHHLSVVQAHTQPIVDAIDWSTERIESKINNLKRSLSTR